MRCHTLVNIERQKLAPKLSEKYVFSVWLTSTICMKSHEIREVGKPNTKSLLFTPSMQQLCHKTRMETDQWLQESACSRTPLHFGHPVHSAVFNPSGHMPCTMSLTARVKYCICVAPLFPVCFLWVQEILSFMSWASLLCGMLQSHQALINLWSRDLCMTAGLVWDSWLLCIGERSPDNDLFVSALHWQPNQPGSK